MTIIAANRVAAIHYTLTDDDGEEIETTRGGDPMPYLHGAGDIVEGLERQLHGRRAGERVQALVLPSEGYGVRSGRPPQPLPLESFEGVDPQPGMPLVIENDDGRQLKLWVTSVSDDAVMVTPDHPLAGLTLHFDVEVMWIRDATEAELQQGHADTGDDRARLDGPTMNSTRAGLAALCGTMLEGRYELVRILGAGGMGAVFEAKHLRLDRDVAIKVLRPDFANKDDAIRRFLREAKAASKVRHRNVVELLDYGETPQGLVYSVMEYLVGQDLQQLLRSQPGQRLPWERACGLLVQIASGLKAAHGCGVIHRDVKPANCFLTTEDGEPVVKLVDFGIAKIVDVEATQQLTGAAQVLGTPSYIAPELALHNLPASPRSDIYSFGVLMYRMLTGRLPFSGDTVVAVLMAGCFNPVPSLREQVPELPEEVEAFVLELMSKDPEGRPPDMLTVRRRLVALSRATLSPQAVQLALSDAMSLDMGASDSFQDIPAARLAGELRNAAQREPIPRPSSSSSIPTTVEPKPALLDEGSAASTSARPRPVPAPAPAQPRRRLWIGLAVAAVLLTLGALTLPGVIGGEGGQAPRGHDEAEREGEHDEERFRFEPIAPKTLLGGERAAPSPPAEAPSPSRSGDPSGTPPP